MTRASGSEKISRDTYPSPIRIERSTIAVNAGEAPLARMRKDFAANDFVAWRGLLEPELLTLVLTKIDAASFMIGADTYSYMRMEGVLQAEINEFISFLFRDRRIYEVVRAVTGCPPIETFNGRVLRSCPGKNHFLNWHCDMYMGQTQVASRRIASLRLNLSREPWQGGAMEFKRSPESPGVTRYRSAACGDAILFKSRDGFHRNAPVTGSVPKITFSGWFYGYAQTQTP